MQPLNREHAESVAISGLQRLASDDDLLMRFSTLTGILANDMRSAATQAGFLVGVLDFFLSHEPDLMAWMEAEGMDPELPIRARQTLAPEDVSGFE